MFFALTQILNLGIVLWKLLGAWRAVTGPDAAIIVGIYPAPKST